MKKVRNFCVALFLFAFAFMGLFQTVVFRQYASEATYIYALQLLGLNSPEDDGRLGRICNALGRNRCAQAMFRHLQEAHPSDLEDMASLAIVLTKGNKAAEALPYFQAYIAGGGGDDTAVRWYASALDRTGASELSIPWYYRALAANVHDREVAADLLAALEKTGRGDEALSLREQISELAHFSAVELKTVSAEREPANTVDDDSPAAKNEYYFPSIDGRNFYLPFHFRENRSEFITADPDRKTSVINEVDLARWGLAPHVNGAGRVMIKELKIGQLAIHNAEMEVCDECKTMLGADILAKASGRVDTRNKIALLILTDSD